MGEHDAKVIPIRAPRGRSESEQNDDELMSLAQAGAKDAFDTLVRRHQMVTLRYARRELGSIARAHDAARDTFVELHRALARYEVHGKFRVVLHRILLERCRRMRRVESRVEEKPALSGELSDDLILERERHKELVRALDRSKAADREALLLRFIAELSPAEIAEVVSAPVGKVESRLSRGVAKLRDELLGPGDARIDAFRDTVSLLCAPDTELDGVDLTNEIGSELLQEHARPEPRRTLASKWAALLEWLRNRSRNRSR